MAQNKPSNCKWPSKYEGMLGSNIRYVESGEGEPILFSHGQPT
jgi:hypothetical protein